MDSQQDTSGGGGAHCITIEEPSLLEKGKGKLGESGEAEMDANTAEAMDSQEDISAAFLRNFMCHEHIRESSVLKSKLTSKLRKADDCKEVTIFRVPMSIRENNKNMFEPSVVSIGPYYRGLPHLRAMEEKKLLLLRDFLIRTRCALRDCISKIKKLEKRARCCYSEPFDMTSDDFVEMMVLDGCFILEYFQKSLETEDSDPITEGWTISTFVETDLILLENQIPFIIIETLWGSPFDPLVLEKIASTLACDIPTKAPSHPQKIHHLLHLCHCHVVPTRSTDQNAASEPNHRPSLNCIRAVPAALKYFCSEKKGELDERMVWQIPCATELEEAGVKFEKHEKSDDLTKITFQSGTLVIPRLLISDEIKPVFMNLVALEQCMYFQLPTYFSTYISFLDYLVNTPHDVSILQKKGILENMLSSEEEVALFFNQSCVNVATPPNHYLAELFMRVNKYRESRFHRYRARLSRDYFNNPWSIIALIAATLLVCLTIIQTVMSVYSYIRPP